MKYYLKQKEKIKMTINESAKYLKDKIQEYSDEIDKLEKQKMGFLELDKRPPKKINKRISECNILINYFGNILRELQHAEQDQCMSQSKILLNYSKY